MTEMCISCRKRPPLEGRMLCGSCYQRGKLEDELRAQQVIRTNKEKEFKQQLDSQIKNIRPRKP